MTGNMNRVDRGLRAFLVAPAAIMLATSAVGFCPLYALLHINTRGPRAAAALKEEPH